MIKKQNEIMKRMEDNRYIQGKKLKEDKELTEDKKLTKYKELNEENKRTEYKKQNEDNTRKEDKKPIEQEKNIEIWEDLVRIKDLLLAFLICVSTTFFGYFIAPNDAPKPLFFGLIGAMIGFIITSIIINPKRELVEGDGEG